EIRVASPLPWRERRATQLPIAAGCAGLRPCGEDAGWAADLSWPQLTFDGTAIVYQNWGKGKFPYLLIRCFFAIICSDLPRRERRRRFVKRPATLVMVRDSSDRLP